MVTWLTFGVLLVRPGRELGDERRRAAGRQQLDLGGADVRAAAAPRQQRRRRRRHGHRFGDGRAQRHVEALDRSEADAHHAGHGLEAGELELEGVVAGGEPTQLVGAGLIGGRAARALQSRGLHMNRGVRHDLAGGVGDHAPHGTGLHALSGGTGDERNREQSDERAR